MINQNLFTLTVGASDTPVFNVDDQGIVTHVGINVGRRALTANASGQVQDAIVAYTALAAARTFTLVPAASVAPGTVVIIQDESGNAATNNLTVAGAGSDTISGAANKVISANFGSLRLYSDGVSKWFSF